MTIATNTAERDVGRFDGAVGVDDGAVNVDRSIGLQRDTPRSVTDGYFATGFDPNMLAPTTRLQPYAIVRKPFNAGWQRPKTRNKERIMQVMESSQRIISYAAGLFPAIYAALTEQNQALIAGVDLVNNVVLSATKEKDGYVSNGGWVDNAPIYRYFLYTYSDLRTLQIRVKSQHMTGHAGTHAFHHFDEGGSL